MFGKAKKIQQLEDELRKAKGDWAQDQSISKQMIDYRTEECKTLAVRCAQLEQEVDTLRSVLAEIATKANTMAVSTPDDEPKIIKGYDHELAALLDQEEDLRKATTTVWQMADMLSTSTTWILDLCKELDIEAVSHSSRLTPRQVELVSNLAEERRKERS